MKKLSFPKPAVWISRPAFSVALLLCAGVELRAEDNTTTSYTSGTATNVGLIVIGDTGINNSLVISNATRVLTTTGVVGVATSANFNNALVTGPGTFWTNTLWFVIGSNGSFNTLVVSNGARLVTGQNNQNVQTMIGRGPDGSNNTVIVTGSDTVWTIRNNNLRVGFESGGGNQLMITDGGQVTIAPANTAGQLALGDGNVSSPIGGRNIVTVSGSNSLLSMTSSIQMGRFSPHNQLIVTNGGRLVSRGATFGLTGNNETNNTLIVTGTGSVWESSGDIRIQRRHNVLRIEDGGIVSTPTNLLGIAATVNTRDNMVRISGGTLAVTNAAGTGFYHIVRGSNVLNSGTLTVDSILMTNGVNSLFVFNGGTFNTRNSTFSNVALFVVGDGASSATLNLQGGTHQFFNGLRINTNATLMGTGTVTGDTTVIGTLAPGDGPGILDVGNVTLVSNSTFEVELNGTILGSEYDQLDVAGIVNLSNSVLNILLDYPPTQGDTFTIINNDATDAIQGRFLGRPQESEFAAAGGEFKINYFGGTGNDVLLTVVPEPSSSALLGIGGLLLFWRRKRSAE